MARSIVVPFAAGALLSLGCAEREAVRPPTPVVHEPPPAPEPQVATPAPASMPTWEQAAYRGLEGGPAPTNPPIPVLLVQPDGTCHLGKEDARGGPPRGWNQVPTSFVGSAYIVEQCGRPDAPCSIQVQCPPAAIEALKAWAERAVP